MGSLEATQRSYLSLTSWQKASRGVCGQGPGTDWWPSPDPWTQELVMSAWKTEPSTWPQLSGPWLQWLRALMTARFCENLCTHRPQVQKVITGKAVHPKAALYLAWKQSSPAVHSETARTVLLLLLSRFSRVRLYATPEMAAHQAPPSLGFSRQEHWSESVVFNRLSRR